MFPILQVFAVEVWCLLWLVCQVLCWFCLFTLNHLYFILCPKTESLYGHTSCYTEFMTSLTQFLYIYINGRLPWVVSSCKPANYECYTHRKIIIIIIIFVLTISHNVQLIRSVTWMLYRNHLVDTHISKTRQPPTHKLWPLPNSVVIATSVSRDIESL